MTEARIGQATNAFSTREFYSDSAVLISLPTTYGELVDWLREARKYKHYVRDYVHLASPLEFVTRSGLSSTEIPWTIRLRRIFQVLQRQILTAWARTQQNLGELADLMARAEICIAQEQQVHFGMDNATTSRMLYRPIRSAPQPGQSSAPQLNAPLTSQWGQP